MGALIMHLKVMPEPSHSLFHLMENWQHDSGMLTAFVHLPPLLCIHLDRLKPMTGTRHGPGAEVLW